MTTPPPVSQSEAWRPMFSAPYDELVEWRIDAMGVRGQDRIIEGYQMIMRKYKGKKPYWVVPQADGTFLITGWDEKRVTAWRPAADALLSARGETK